MTMRICDPYLAEHLRAERKATGADRWDEVWEGVYVVAPLPNDEHQELVADFVYVFKSTAGPAAKVRPRVNVSDRDEGWTHNYRGPDVVVFLPGTKAVNRGTHWVGGPDFAVEILSEEDRSREKLPFYGKVGVHELLMVDRNPWALELYRLEGEQLALVSRSTPERPETLASQVLPLAFRLVEGEERPRVEVTHRDGVRKWNI